MNETVDLNPKPGDARVTLIVRYGDSMVSKAFDLKDYSGHVPGPQKNAHSLMERLVAVLRAEYGKISDVP